LLIEGFATAQGTKHYAELCAGFTAVGHFSEFLKTRMRLSSLGIGTFPGLADGQVDRAIADIVARAVGGGINVIDTATHYRYGRSLKAVGLGLQKAFDQGVAREAVYIVSKGGFLCFPDGPPADFNNWFESEIVAQGLGSLEDLAASCHLLTPAHIRHQLDQSRTQIGVNTLDAFLIDQPEIHIAEIGKENLNRKLLPVFVELEKAVAEGVLRGYGISTFNGFRVATDDVMFQSLTSLLGLAEKAAKQVLGGNGQHHFQLIQMPFNQVMTEGFTRFSQATGQDNIASTVQAAYQLNLYVMSSHSLMKGKLAQQSLDIVTKMTSDLENPAQRAMQFNRSTPGIGTALVGMSQERHLDDMLKVAATVPLERKTYLQMYQRTEE